MIKRNQTNIKQQLLRKNSDESTFQYPPFEIEECYSIVDCDSRDQSYFYIGNEPHTNPCTIELTEKQSEKTMQNNKSENSFPQKTPLNDYHYQRIDNDNHQNKTVEQLKVQCGICTTHQLIPKHSNKFYCYHCSTLNKCSINSQKPSKQNLKIQQKKITLLQQNNVPIITKLFICGRCHVKVKYQPGISLYIRCLQCNTVNLVAE